MASTTKIFIDGAVPLEAVDSNGFTLENNNLIESANIGLNSTNNNQTASCG